MEIVGKRVSEILVEVEYKEKKLFLESTDFI